VSCTLVDTQGLSSGMIAPKLNAKSVPHERSAAAVLRSYIGSVSDPWIGPGMKVTANTHERVAGHVRPLA
jgi:hypothetical protein